MAGRDEAEQAAFERLKAELDMAFSQPDESARPFDVEEFLARNRRRFSDREG